MKHLFELYRRLSVYTEDRQHAAYTLMVGGCLLGLASDGWLGVFSACALAWVLLERLPAVDGGDGPPAEEGRAR